MTNINPIWKDYYVSFYTNNSPVNYSIRLNGEAIFYGKAWCPPSYEEEEFTIKINKICENYLSNNIENFDGTQTTEGITIEHTDAIKTFQIYNEDIKQMVDEVTFVYDYSYDTSVDYSRSVYMNKPINRKGKDGMYFMQTIFDGTSIKTNLSKLKNNGYTLINDCNSKWAIYYLNRYGGWDCYLIESYVSKKDNFVRSNVTRHYNNTTQEFGETPYLTEISTTYEIHTGWLSEKESETLAHNLFQSTRLFLHNLETDTIIPVILTDADVLYKNHKNSGRKLLNYTINVMTSQKQHNKN